MIAIAIVRTDIRRSTQGHFCEFWVFAFLFVTRSRTYIANIRTDSSMPAGRDKKTIFLQYFSNRNASRHTSVMPPLFLQGIWEIRAPKKKLRIVEFEITASFMDSIFLGPFPEKNGKIMQLIPSQTRKHFSSSFFCTKNMIFFEISAALAVLCDKNTSCIFNRRQ